jgi:hypothetical protein
MASAETLACMAELYQGEIAGEIMFEALIAEHESPAARHLLGAVLQAESETKARLRPAMVRLGVPITASELSRNLAETYLAPLKGLAWPDFLAALDAGVRSVGVPRYEEIARIAAADGDPIAVEVANYMVIHETALAEMVARAIEGDPSPTRGLDALLHFPLPPPCD